MRVEVAVRTLAVEVGQGRVVRTGAGDHHVVDLLWQALEELVEGGRVGGVEGRGAQRAEFGRSVLQALGIAARQYDVRALGACLPGGFEPDAGAAADHDDGPPVQFAFALAGKDGGWGGHNSSGGAGAGNGPACRSGSGAGAAGGPWPSRRPICNAKVTRMRGTVVPLERELAEDTGLLWRALADPTRRQILDLLRQRPLITGAIAAQFPISRSAVMRHLDVLSQAGLVTSRKRGRERWHYLNAVPLQKLHRRCADPAAAGFASALLRLHDTVE